MGNIDLPEDITYVKKKIMGALTGGRDTVEEQKQKGGQPEKCMIFEIYKQHLVEDDKELQQIYDDCKSGKLLCGEDKKNCCAMMEKFMKDFESRVGKARKQVDKLKFIKFK
jgi:tryptophanyl-tRNA synthetase